MHNDYLTFSRKQMKHLSIILLIFSPLFAKTQNINIPDYWFKQMLLSQYDTSGDREIQVGEALTIRNLRINEMVVIMGSEFVRVSPINLAGIETFANLETLVLAAPGTKHVNVAGLTMLKSIKLNGFYGELNKLTKLNVTGCSGLDTLILHGENFLLDSLNLSSCTNLRFFECYSMYRISSLSVRDCSNLRILRLGYTYCKRFDFSGLVNLEEISFGGDAEGEILSVFDWGGTPLNHLKKVNINSAWITNLDFSQCLSLDSVALEWTGFSNSHMDLSNAPYLKHFVLYPGYLRDSVNRLDSLTVKNGSAFISFRIGFPLQYICADAFEADTLQQYFANINHYPFISSSCSFSTLPIHVEYFSLNKKENSNQLNWKASCTYGNAAFAIERSDDGIHFKSIGNITATALRCQLPFNFMDNNPVAGKNYYRLKISDAEGKSFYSKILVVGNNKAGFEITAVANNTLNLQSNKQQMITMIVIAADGRVVIKKKQTVGSGNSNISLPMKNTAEGIYTLIVYTDNGEITTKRFVK